MRKIFSLFILTGIFLHFFLLNSSSVFAVTDKCDDSYNALKKEITENFSQVMLQYTSRQKYEDYVNKKILGAGCDQSINDSYRRKNYRLELGGLYDQFSVELINAVPPASSQEAYDPKNISAIINQKCGNIGETCCRQGVLLPSPLRIPKIDIPAVGSVLNYMVTPLNLYLAAMDPITETVRGPISKLVGSSPACASGRPTNPASAQCMCVAKENFKVQSLCVNISTQNERADCIKCNAHGIWTALGCFDYELPKLIQDKLFGLGLGLAGITAFFCILYAAFLMQMSQGNPEKIKKAQELLVGCISGLILIIFSIFILRVIGVEILRIPGFG